MASAGINFAEITPQNGALSELAELIFLDLQEQTVENKSQISVDLAEKMARRAARSKKTE